MMHAVCLFNESKCIQHSQRALFASLTAIWMTHSYRKRLCVCGHVSRLLLCFRWKHNVSETDRLASNWSPQWAGRDARWHWHTNKGYRERVQAPKQGHTLMPNITHTFLDLLRVRSTIKTLAVSKPIKCLVKQMLVITNSPQRFQHIVSYKQYCAQRIHGLLPYNLARTRFYNYGGSRQIPLLLNSRTNNIRVKCC